MSDAVGPIVAVVRNEASGHTHVSAERYKSSRIRAGVVAKMPNYSQHHGIVSFILLARRSQRRTERITGSPVRFHDAAIHQSGHILHRYRVPFVATAR